MRVNNWFNVKWKDHIEYGHYGMDLYIDNKELQERIWKYLDKEFEEHVKNHPDFEFAQIKTKFGSPRIYTNAGVEKEQEWETEVNKILKQEDKKEST